MRGAPDGVAPGRPVPEAAQEHHDEEVDVSAHRAAAVAAEGEVEVLAQPGAERDVPAPPELGQVTGEIRMVEVQRELVTEQAGQPHRDEGVAGEIGVNLARVGVEQGHQVQLRQGQERRVTQGGGRFFEVVGDDHLEEEAGDELLDGIVPVEVGQALVADLIKELARLHDGPGHELGEKGLEEPDLLVKPAELAEVAGRGEAGEARGAGAVGIDHQADALEGEEGNPHWQRHLRQPGMRELPPPRRQQQFGQERRVLEQGQDAEVYEQRRQERLAAGGRRQVRAQQPPRDDGVHRAFAHQQEH